MVALSLGANTVAIRINEIADGTYRKLRGKSYDQAVFDPPLAPGRGAVAGTAVIYGKPNVQVMNLPIAGSTAVAHAPWIAATARPWPGGLNVYRRTGPTTFRFNRLISQPATQGRLLTSLLAGRQYFRPVEHGGCAAGPWRAVLG